MPRSPVGSDIPSSTRAATESKARRRLEYFRAARGLGGAESDETARATAQERITTIERMGQAGPLTTAQWYSIGPTVMHNGQTYGSGGNNRVDVAGRVSSVAVDPSNPAHILAGPAGGGIWETHDTGATWSPRTDQQPSLTTGAITFNPSNPSVVYAGTGEGDWYMNQGAGLLRSVDGGTTWTMRATEPFVGQSFHQIIVDPANGHHLLAATVWGLFESGDAGVTWTSRHNALAWSISMRPLLRRTHEVLLAASDGLHRSTDGGTTWTAQALPGAPASWSRLAVAHAPSDPRIAYAFGAEDNTTGYLWQRGTTGTWSAITPPAALSTGQSWYDWFLVVSPDNPNQIYLGEISTWRGDLTGSTWSWQNLSAKSSGDSIHPDQHALAVDPSNPDTIYIGCDGGLYRSPDRGISFSSLNNGLAITEIEYIAQDVGRCRWVMAGTQDNGSIRYTGNTAWDHIADGDGGDCGVDRANPDIVFHSYYNMSLERSGTRGDFGSWTGISPPVSAGYVNLFYPPVAVCNTTVAQAGQSVFISRDSGATWHEAVLPSGLDVSAMTAPTTDRVVAATGNGRVFHVDWVSGAWAAPVEVTAPRPGAWISSVWADASNVNVMWATSSFANGGTVFSSTDGGSTWTDRSAGLPDLAINDLEVDPQNLNRVWVAADLGVYQSLDGGQSWASFSASLPNALVESLALQPYSRLLRAGTRSRGVWETSVDAPLTEPQCGVQWTGTIAANSTGRWFTFNWPATWDVLWSVMPTSIDATGAQISCSTAQARGSGEFITYWITVTNTTATPVTFEGRYAILSWC